MQKLLVFGGAEVARPHDACVVDVRVVVNPFVLENMLRPIANEHELLAGRLHELSIDGGAALRASFIEKASPYQNMKCAMQKKTIRRAASSLSLLERQ